MKILHVLNTGSFSGAENVVCQIISLFNNEEDIKMAYCSLSGTIKEVLEEKKITHFLMKKMSKNELKEVIDFYKPDIIHAHDMKASFVSSLVCKKIPIISHIHNNAYDSRKINLKSIAYLLATLKIKHIYWVSKSSFEGYVFKYLVKNKSEILYNIIDGKKTRERAEEDTKSYNYDVVYLGRLTYEKNPQRLIDILKKIIHLNNKIKIAIIGNGDLADVVKSVVKKQNLAQNITLLGYVSNPLKILKCSKVMLLTSRWEGTPMCVLEAMALGVPIVSTPVDGVKDLIKTGINGFLTDDDIDFAESVIKIVEDDTLRKNMSLETIKRFDEYCDIDRYRGILKGCYVLLKYKNKRF